MKILGITKSSFIDFPGKISTVIFTGGCNFQCPYCHNGPLAKGEGEQLSKDEIMKYIKKRKKFVDAICISGGEPTLQEDLTDFIKELKNEGFYVKLDTNGTNYKLLKELMEEDLLDYVAMDIKAPFKKYSLVAQGKTHLDSINRSIQFLKSSNISYEFRTTVCKELLTKEDVVEIAESLRGSKGYYIQNFRERAEVLGGCGKLSPFSKEDLEEVKLSVNGYFSTFDIR